MVNINGEEIEMALLAALLQLPEVRASNNCHTINATTNLNNSLGDYDFPRIVTELEISNGISNSMPTISHLVNRSIIIVHLYSCILVHRYLQFFCAFALDPFQLPTLFAIVNW